jgi:hypothetical protein
MKSLNGLTAISRLAASMNTSPVPPAPREAAQPADSEAVATAATAGRGGPEPTTGRGGIPRAASERLRWDAYVPAAAGVTYLVAWAVGFAVWPVNLALNAPAAQVAASHRAHPAEAVSQYVLVEGLAGLLFGAVLAYALVPVLSRRGGRASLSGWGALALAAIAVVTSLTQCVLALMTTAAATRDDIARCGALMDLVNRLDGVKMIALAAATALIAAIASPVPVLPRWLRLATVPLGLALVASGYAYLTLSNGLAWTAFLSGTLLLLWVTSTGIALTSRRRVRRPASR